jgi:hypothetical protein
LAVLGPESSGLADGDLLVGGAKLGPATCVGWDGPLPWLATAGTVTGALGVGSPEPADDDVLEVGMEPIVPGPTVFVTAGSTFVTTSNATVAVTVALPSNPSLTVIFSVRLPRFLVVEEVST